LLSKAFPSARPERVPSDHALLRVSGNNQRLTLKPRPYTIEAMPNGVAEINLLKVGKGYTVLCPLDLTTALLGTNTWGILGYEPNSAAQLMRNVLLWSRSLTAGGG
jgi:hypothetical protein